MGNGAGSDLSRYDALKTPPGLIQAGFFVPVRHANDGFLTYIYTPVLITGILTVVEIFTHAVVAKELKKQKERVRLNEANQAVNGKSIGDFL